MKKISVTMLFVLALALLVGCTNAATGGTGSGSETENDYLAHCSVHGKQKVMTKENL